MRLRDVLKVIPVASSAWWAGVKTGRFPQPVKLGPRKTEHDYPPVYRDEVYKKIFEQAENFKRHQAS
ncbi:MAG: hypothetical protein SWH61_12995 [Thermodesulfobacteriota bacterium]|nr:hypothetical protein [Thermodesulfobacteriota bacterium]